VSDGTRTALVTGASRGIGRAIAHRLAADGHRVVCCSASDGSKETQRELEANGHEAMAVTADVRDPAAVDAAFSEVEAAFGPVEILVNNAGVTADGLIARMTDEAWEQVLATNLTGAFHTIRRATPKLLRARWGRIVNISSVSGYAGSAGQANYAAAKAGLIGLTRAVARELASRAITCNVVAPGPIVTDMTETMPADWRASIEVAVPLGRLGTPSEVAGLVAFSCSETAAYMTGAVLPVDGGLGMGH
jgi:3-oxoacyl-[acyl-carrier protein] reductase